MSAVNVSSSARPSPEPGQEIRASPIGLQADPVECLADGRVGRGHSDVARKREIRSTSRGGAIHGGEHGLGQAVDGQNDLRAEVHQRLERVPLLARNEVVHVSDVGAGAERSSRSGDDQRAECVIARHCRDYLGEFVAHATCECVQRLRTVQVMRPTRSCRVKSTWPDIEFERAFYSMQKGRRRYEGRCRRPATR
jgi:hypothetical protein